MENLKVYTKLFNIRKSIGKINKDKQGYNYNYADLQNIKNEVDSKLEENNCLLTISFKQDLCEAYFIDVESGEKLLFTSPIDYKDALTKESLNKDGSIKVSKMSPLQDIGAMHTYMRRYMYILILDLAVEDEIDKNNKPIEYNKSNTWKSKTNINNNNNTYSGLTGNELDNIIDLDNQANNQSVSDDVICEILDRCNSDYTLQRVKKYYDAKNWSYNGKPISVNFVENAIKNKWIK